MSHETKTPSRVYIDVTNACPLQCLHCCTASGERRADELSLVEIINLVDQVQGMQVKNLVLTGGEPLARADLPAILRHACQQGLNITLLTNGILLDRSWAKLLAELGVRVKISLDGVSAETHNFLRGNGAFEMATQALERLRAAGAENLAVHFTVHRQNCREIARLPELLSELGIHNLVVGLIKPSGRAKDNPALLIPPAMAAYVRQKIEALTHCEQITLQRLSDKCWGSDTEDLFGCPATCNKLGVGATGETTTCTFLGQEFMGKNVREYPLAELWQQHLAGGKCFVANAECAECPNLPFSGGGCRARALYYRQDINAPDPYCCASFAKKRFLDQHRPLLEQALAGPELAFQD